MVFDEMANLLNCLPPGAGIIAAKLVKTLINPTLKAGGLDSRNWRPLISYSFCAVSEVLHLQHVLEEDTLRHSNLELCCHIIS